MKWKYKWNELFFFNDILSEKIKNWTQSSGMLLVSNLTNMEKQKVSKQNGKSLYYIDWFADIEESLHPWDKAHLVMVYDLFNVLLDSDC